MPLRCGGARRGEGTIAGGEVVRVRPVVTDRPQSRSGRSGSASTEREGRQESADERADRMWVDLLQELRVASPVCRFSSEPCFWPSSCISFTTLGGTNRVLYLAAVILGAATAGPLTGPVSLHRVITGRHIKPQAVALASLMTIAITAWLAIVSLLLPSWAGRHYTPPRLTFQTTFTQQPFGQRRSWPAGSRARPRSTLLPSRRRRPQGAALAAVTARPAASRIPAFGLPRWSEPPPAWCSAARRGPAVRRGRRRGGGCRSGPRRAGCASRLSCPGRPSASPPPPGRR
ncbi:DUF6328 family protein [Streptomyces sp. NPDC060333]|uniref:DUF6328 family protein n=1 Tax=Streptomyces sp. NPDC060333 TaxID=3347098 RepID=UPI0036599D3E